MKQNQRGFEDNSEIRKNVLLLGVKIINIIKLKMDDRVESNKVLKNEAANDTTGSSVAVNNNSSVVKTDHTNSPTTII